MPLPKGIGTMREEGMLSDKAASAPWRGLLRRKNTASQRHALCLPMSREIILSRRIRCDTIRAALGHGAMAAHQPLELWILVRIQAPQPFVQPAQAGIFLSAL